MRRGNWNTNYTTCASGVGNWPSEEKQETLGIAEITGEYRSDSEGNGPEFLLIKPGREGKPVLHPLDTAKGLIWNRDVKFPEILNPWGGVT